MNSGLLWFDNDPKSDLQNKVNQAAEYYRKKYGKNPNLCFVHPSMLVQENLKTNQVALRAAPSMLPHHFWIGIEDLAPQPEH